MNMRVFQINLQKHFGGGEVYTAFLCNALAKHGVQTILFASASAGFWKNMNLPENIDIQYIHDVTEIIPQLPSEKSWILAHGPVPESICKVFTSKHLLTAMAHMPIQGRNPRSYDGHDMVFPVSNWVREGLLENKVQSWHEPLYGVASLESRKEDPNSKIVKESCFDWDRRKFRDRAFGVFYPFVQALSSKPVYQKRPGLSIGIVSRLTPIKQFPLLFSYLSPILKKHPNVNIEIFGSGGYASVRDLKQALAPIADRVRFWGHQKNVSAVYTKLDYLISGLPEKEALGLNIIEAQACNLPVLAVNAPPFIETVLDGKSGFLFTDPRKDQGADFDRLLAQISALDKPLVPIKETEHLFKFSTTMFEERIAQVVKWAKENIS